MRPIVRTEMPSIDGCPILSRYKAFLVDRGVPSTLEHIFRDRRGNPFDLTSWFYVTVSQSLSDSLSDSLSETVSGGVKVRIREWVSSNFGDSLIWEGDGWVVDAEHGVVRCDLPNLITNQPGIYEVHWAILGQDGQPVALDRTLLSVEYSLFGPDNLARTGPPTLQEIRMAIMDSSRHENLLLDDIEFKDEQILLAITQPIVQWNESPPPIETFTTQNFPFRQAWLKGIVAQLYLMAAHHYRRNRLPHSAGGVAIDDKNKEREYMQEGMRLKAEYDAWLTNKKIEINAKKFFGQYWSPYSGI